MVCSRTTYWLFYNYCHWPPACIIALLYASCPEGVALVASGVPNQVQAGTGDVHHPHTTVPRLYLTDSVRPYSYNDPARYRLRSATGTNYCVPRMRTKFGDRAFSVAGPVVWNSLPAAVRHADSLHSFKRRLKSHFFSLCFND